MTIFSEKKLNQLNQIILLYSKFIYSIRFINIDFFIYKFHFVIYFKNALFIYFDLKFDFIILNYL